MRKQKKKNPIKPVLLTTPFNTVTPKHRKKKELGWIRYPHIPILITNPRLKRQLLGLRLQFTLKDDGQNVTIWLRKKKYAKGGSSLYAGLISMPKGYEVIVSSHNQEVASGDITSRVQKSKEYPIILKLIKNNPTFRVVAEEIAKGPSITGIRQYERDMLIVVDIFDTSINNYLPYTAVYQYCYHYGLPVVKLYATTRHRTITDLNKFIHHVLEYCNTEKDYGKDEGMVLKTFDADGEYVQAKVKLDIPRPIVERIREGPPKLPQIPESEIMGAISHVEADFGLTGEPAHDMPLIAKEVSNECKKHYYSSRGNLFQFYQEYMERVRK